jgi:hypothetical protein
MTVIQRTAGAVAIRYASASVPARAEFRQATGAAAVVCRRLRVLRVTPPKIQSSAGAEVRSLRAMATSSTRLERRSEAHQASPDSTADLLVTMAIIESALGAALLMAPTITAHAISGAVQSSPMEAPVVRLAGAALFAIGVCCFLGRLSESTSVHGRPFDLVPGLAVFNACAVAVLTDTLMRDVRAPLLWPAMIIHSALLVWCVAVLAGEHSDRR